MRHRSWSFAAFAQGATHKAELPENLKHATAAMARRRFHLNHEDCHENRILCLRATEDLL